MMNIRAARAGLRVQEIPSHERCRVYGASNLRVVFDGWRILKVIVAEALAERAGRNRARSHLAADRASAIGHSNG